MPPKRINRGAAANLADLSFELPSHRGFHATFTISLKLSSVSFASVML